MSERKGCGRFLSRLLFGKDASLVQAGGFTNEEFAQHFFGDEPGVAKEFEKYLEDLTTGKTRAGFTVMRGEDGKSVLKRDESLTVEVDDREIRDFKA